MFISRNIAQAIVEEIGDEIHEHINMMDSKGVIIASTDRERIGQIHEGARRIITEELSELYITDEMETATTKKGTNLPLIVNNEIIGVVGITGDREQVQRYGNIVRRMTEIMVEDGISKDVKKYDRRMKYRFMEEWIAKSNASYSENFVKRGKNLGIDVEKPYRVMSFNFLDYQQLSDTVEGQKEIEDMESSVRHAAEKKNILYLREPPRQILLLPVCSDEEMRKTASQLILMIDKKYGRRMVAGFDSKKGNKYDIQQSCLESGKAVAQAMISEDKYCYYDNLNIELFINEISDNAMKEYLDKLFVGVSEEKIEEYIHLMEQYFVYEGSIGKIADSMFMHKNTLQNKLKKLAEVTGKDIRIPSNASVLFMAMRFYHKLYKNNRQYRRTIK